MWQRTPFYFSTVDNVVRGDYELRSPTRVNLAFIPISCFIFYFT
jgi:hypothetical protein